jgi:hypothetical protein
MCLLFACFRQPAPRDTPEHAAALQLFLNKANLEVMQECVGGSDKLLLCAMSGSNGRSSGSSGGSNDLDLSLLPHSSEARAWELAPLLDLQLHVPPQLLLQLLVQLQERLQQTSEQQQAHEPYLLLGRLARSDTLTAVDSLLCPVFLRALHGPVPDLLHATARSSADHEQRPQQQHEPAGQGTGSQSTPGSSSSVTDDLIAAAAAAILQSGLGPGLDGVGVGRIASLAYHLVLKFLQYELSEWGFESQQWQQAVPLQALQLLSAVRAVEATGQAAAEAASAAQTDPASCSSGYGATRQAAPAAASQAGSLHAAAAEQSAQHKAMHLQQQLVQMLVSLVQRVSHYRDCNAALGPDSCHFSQHRSTLDGTPHKVFAAAEEQRSMGAGIWHSPGEGPSASPDSSNSSSSSRTGYSARTWKSNVFEAFEGVLCATAGVQDIQLQIDEVLRDACSSEEAMAELHAYLLPAAESAFPDDLQDDSIAQWVKDTPETLQQVGLG